MNNPTSPKFALLCACSLLIGVSTRGQTIAQWTFESNTATNSGPIAADIGLGSASGSHAGAAVYSSPAGNGSPHSYSVNTWAVNDYWQFSSSTIGYSGIELEWDQTSSGTGPRDFILSYSTDGTSFSQFGSQYSVLANASPNPTWNASTSSSLYHFAVDLSSIAGLNNQGSVYFRLVDNSTTSANGGTVATAGTDRLDNFTIEVVPEPTSAALGLLGVGFAAWLRRFRK
jgi:PEP-CTERM motif